MIGSKLRAILAGKMDASDARPRRTGLLVVGGIVAVSLGGTAVAITDTAFTYSSPRTGYYGIHAMDMAPDGRSSAAASNYSVNYSAGSLAGSFCYNTGVHLPNGATITRLSIWYTSTTGAPAVRLYKNPVQTGGAEAIAEFILPDDSGARVIFDFVPPASAPRVVDNLRALYGFGICLSDPDTFRGARITYTYTSAGD